MPDLWQFVPLLWIPFFMVLAAALLWPLKDRC